MISIKDRFRGCLLGVIIGDALSTPYEMKIPEQILKMTNGKGVCGFDPNIIRKRTDNKNILSSDDWALTEVVGKSLLRRGYFDIVDQALAHVEYVEQNGTEGFGSTTKKGITELKEYFDSRGLKGRSPFDRPKHVEGKGSGNGIAMKCMPILLQRFGVNEILFQDDFVELGKLTHSNAASWAAAYALCLCLNCEFNSPEFNQKLLKFDIEFKIDYKYYINKLNSENIVSCSISDLAKEVGNSCLAIESVPFSIALWLRNKNNFKNGLLEAVNAGGDTDSIASMTGALIGFNVGIQGIPKEWIDYSSEFEKAIVLADELCKKFAYEK